MKRTSISRKGVCALAAVLLLLGSGAATAAAQEVLGTDLSPLIDQSAAFPTRFAVDVPHAVSTAGAGSWTQSGTRSTWTYSIRIPTAVSVSFHASHLNLPGDAVLTVTGKNGGSASYQARDIARGALWSRPLPGDSLALSLSVSAAERPLAALQIESFQAGYRSLGGNVPDNEHYRSLMKKAAVPTSSCTVNYSCQATSANQGPANATAAILVGNVGQCTGTLVNDTSGDGIPYILTARHCENGTLGGGEPGAAANVTVYWDAVTPCDATLGSIYDGTATTQSGATTMVEQQDAWLIKLDSPPAANDAYYSGWDATGGMFSGGYSIHHALGYDKQYVGWYGQPLLQTIPGATLQLGYSSTFWGVVNETGSVGAGASGGALFDPNNNAVGSATLAVLTNGESSAGVCPSTPLQTPSASTLTAYYTALSAIWNSTADTTSSTGAATLKSVLDAANTGSLVVGGTGKLSVTLSADQSTPGTGQTLNLTWNAPGAQVCTPNGGVSGDGWTGSQAASGTYVLTEQSAGQVTYSITCTATGMVGFATVTVDWQLIPAFVSLTGSGPTAYAGGMVSLQWAANTQPCTASGGTSGDGWAGTKAKSGSQSVQASVLGDVTYTLTCGTGTRTATSQYTIAVVAPSASPIVGDANQMLPGQLVTLQFGGGGSCVASGGAPGDGWAGPLSSSTQVAGMLGYTVQVTETVAGTYTYTVTCSGVGATANLSNTTSTTLTFAGSQPTASLSAGPSPEETTGVLNLAWTSNVRPCNITYTGPGSQAGTVTGTDMSSPVGTALDGQEVAGSYVYTLTCGTGQSQAQSNATVVWFTNAPAVTLNVGNPWPLNSPTPIMWQSNVYPCTGTGGLAGDGWAGSKTKALGYQAVTESTLGAVTFGITCGTGSQIVQAQASTTVITPIVSITSNSSTLAVDGNLLLQWSANIGPCTSSISPGSGNFGTVLNTSGGVETSQLIAGTYTYTINCAGVQASTQVTFTGSLTTLTASTANVPVDTPITLSWSSPSYVTSCTASGGSPGDGWTGTLGSAGTKNVTSVSASTVTYSIDCEFGDGPSPAQTQVTYTPVITSQPAVPTPTATLTTSTPNGVVGSSVTLSWTSENANACMASGGASGDGWSGNLSLAGTMSVTETAAGSFTYGIVCTGAPPASSASVDVKFAVTSVTVTGSSGGKSGGGGAVDLWSVSLLGLLMCRRLRRGVGRRREFKHTARIAAEV